MEELVLQRRKFIAEHTESVAQANESRQALKTFLKAKNLDDSLSDKSKNWEMKQIIQHYDSFFDESSGNSREEGINELHKYLKEELLSNNSDWKNLEKKIAEIDKVWESKRLAQESQTTFFPLISMYNPIITSIFLLMFSFCIFFNLVDINLNYLILHISGIAIPSIIISIMLFVWEYYRLYSKIKKYYKISKIIYLFCLKKYTLYKKLKIK